MITHRASTVLLTFLLLAGTLSSTTLEELDKQYQQVASNSIKKARKKFAGKKVDMILKIASKTKFDSGYSISLVSKDENLVTKGGYDVNPIHLLRVSCNDISPGRARSLNEKRIVRVRGELEYRVGRKAYMLNNCRFSKPTQSTTKATLAKANLPDCKKAVLNLGPRYLTRKIVENCGGGRDSRAVAYVVYMSQVVSLKYQIKNLRSKLDKMRIKSEKHWKAASILVNYLEEGGTRMGRELASKTASRLNQLSMPGQAWRQYGSFLIAASSSSNFKGSLSKAPVTSNSASDRAHRSYMQRMQKQYHSDVMKAIERQR